MSFSKENIRYTLNGLLFVLLFAFASIQLSNVPFIKHLGISPLIVGIILGMIYANTLRNHLPQEWVPGILFSSKQLLRLAIILYGFRLTFQQIAAIGVQGLLASVIMVTATFLLGAFLGQKVFGLDRDSALLVTAGSSVCGAAAVLATEPVLKAPAYKSTVAVGTVVLFGTISMFLYPLIYHLGLPGMNSQTYGLYAGSSIHEVAQVMAAASTGGEVASKIAVVVKMTRVLLIAPLLLILGIILSISSRKKGGVGAKIKLVIPWFAVGFIAVSGFNSLHLLPVSLVKGINSIDTFLLTMAMTALGMETSWDKFKQAGLKPVLLALSLFVWLVAGGWGVTYLISKFLPFT